MKKTKNIVIIADGTGRTAKRLMDAVLAQYSEQTVNFSVENIYQQVRTKRRANEILKEISDDYLVLFSIISADLREHFHNRLEERGVLHLDVLEPMLNTMSKFLGVHPDYKPGLLQRIDDNYYHKVDA
ncbi:MAG: kinase/pyrophosphorylase, partial [candidate division Zixibacteria bacterium]|nr:kinase/pyrophosphorylase [candidate division Zixibacteria bacterium]